MIQIYVDLLIMWFETNKIYQKMFYSVSHCFFMIVSFDWKLWTLHLAFRQDLRGALRNSETETSVSTVQTKAERPWKAATSRSSRSLTCLVPAKSSKAAASLLPRKPLNQTTSRNNNHHFSLRVSVPWTRRRTYFALEHHWALRSCQIGEVCSKNGTFWTLFVHKSCGWNWTLQLLTSKVSFRIGGWTCLVPARIPTPSAQPPLLTSSKIYQLFADTKRWCFRRSIARIKSYMTRTDEIQSSKLLDPSDLTLNVERASNNDGKAEFQPDSWPVPPWRCHRIAEAQGQVSHPETVKKSPNTQWVRGFFVFF